MKTNVRVRASGKDMFEGLKAHEYIKARCLNIKVHRIENVDIQAKEKLINNWKVKQ